MPTLPTRDDYDKASPFQKGFLAYLYSAWPGSAIPSEGHCPYAVGSVEHAEFQEGVFTAVLSAQDSEE